MLWFYDHRRPYVSDRHEDQCHRSWEWSSVIYQRIAASLVFHYTYSLSIAVLFEGSLTCYCRTNWVNLSLPSGHGTCIRSMPTPWVCVPDRGFFFCKTNVLRTTPLNPKGQSQCQKSDQWIFLNFLLLLLFIFIFKKAILSAHLYVWWLPVFHSFIIHTVLLSRSLLQRFYHWRSPKDLFDFSERTRLSSS